jgi:hypothetical protein
MTTIQAQIVGDSAVVPRNDFDRLVELARRCEEIDLQVIGDPISTKDIMRLAEGSGAFDFWNDLDEAIYSPSDGEPV